MNEAKASAGRLVMVRHGQASLGSDDYDQLSPLGQHQVALLRDRLEDELGSGWIGFHGTHKRHRQSMSGLRTKQEVSEQEALNEYRVSSLVDSALAGHRELGIRPLTPEMLAAPAAHLQEFMNWFPDVLAAWQEARLNDPVNGPWQKFHDRVRTGVELISRQVRAGHNLLVVSSAGTISTMLAELMGKDLAWQRAINVSMYNTAVCSLSPADEGWSLDAMNCTRHLEDPALRTLA